MSGRGTRVLAVCARIFYGLEALQNNMHTATLARRTTKATTISVAVVHLRLKSDLGVDCRLENFLKFSEHVMKKGGSGHSGRRRPTKTFAFCRDRDWEAQSTYLLSDK